MRNWGSTNSASFIYAKEGFPFEIKALAYNPEKSVNISSYTVKHSDLIEVRDKSKKLTIIDGSLQSKERDVPEYIQLDDKNKTAKLVRVPKFAEVPYPIIMEPNLVIEYYSR